MAILRCLNEFSRESVVLALEPARECACHCTYCFAKINAYAQSSNRSKDLSDPGTFESIVERATSSAYNPEHFLEWSIRNRMILGYANSVEPLQDPDQAKGILKTLDSLSIPIFLQSKGVNVLSLFQYLKPFRDNAVLFLSFPTDDDRALRRFEPGTPLSSERVKVIEAAAAAGFHVVLALSPYHEDWNADPAGFVRRAAGWGVSQVFFDRLHLNRRQRDVVSGVIPVKGPAVRDRVMLAMAGKTEATDWPDGAMDHFRLIYDAALENDLEFYASGFMGTVYGYPNTIASLSPQGVYTRGFQWPYHDGFLFHALSEDFYDDGDGVRMEARDFDDSIVVTWPQVLRSMEFATPVSQPFSWSSMSELMGVSKLPDAWQNYIGKSSPIASYYRAFWNNPTRGQFAWRHPWAKIAKKPNGQYWHDEDGNLIMIYDPDWVSPGKDREAEDLGVFRFFEFGGSDNA